MAYFRRYQENVKTVSFIIRWPKTLPPKKIGFILENFKKFWYYAELNCFSLTTHPRWKASHRLLADTDFCVDDSLQTPHSTVHKWEGIEFKIIQNQLSLLGMFILCMSHVVLAHRGFITREHLSTESLLSQEGKGILGRRKSWASTKGPQPSRRAPQFQRIWNVRTATVLDGSSFGANHRIFFSDLLLRTAQNRR